ncbi:hypothetical protein HN51_069499 [Arachis hypogaea]|uniref:Transketolase C-terminal domain-containing protein n=1 Tax=Arachis hypogaea TaxID=3818 RepID=A0A444Z5W2_ARAHY|nr:hypothetical protein Ahy_B05g077916 [Arachis hypogaea]
MGVLHLHEGREAPGCCRRAAKLPHPASHFLAPDPMVTTSLIAASIGLVEHHGLRITIADARFCKLLDRFLIRSLGKSHEVLITIEEGSIGGFRSHVVQFMALDGLLDRKLKWRPMVLPNRYIDHGSLAHQLFEAGLAPT